MLQVNILETYSPLQIVSVLLFVINSVSATFRNHVGFYDFIVVGSGASGSVVASRLSEKYTVLLIEAGGDPDPDLEIPAKSYSAAANNGYIKKYKTVPEENASLATNGIIEYLVGNTLGGGTAVNGMMYNRGSPHDYDNWATITEDSSWSYREMLKYFKRIEDYHGFYPPTEYHGKGGPITISSQKYAPGLSSWLEAGSSTFGYPNSDPNGQQIPSFTHIEHNLKHGRRVSSYYGYIKPVFGVNKKLTLIKNAKVTKIHFLLNKALGVEYISNDGYALFASVRKEVVLSAGVIGSPVILMKSGIGPPEILRNSKIKLVKKLPVGYNLQDHIYVTLQFLLKKNETEVFDPRRDLTSENFVRYNVTGDGPFSCYNGLTAQALIVSSVRSTEPSPNPEWPDVQYSLVQMPTRNDVGPEDVDISVVIILTRPKSRMGRLFLNTTNTNAPPVINFKYFDHPHDMDTMINGIEQAILLFESNSFPYRKQKARLTGPIPFCTHLPFRSREYWRCYIRYLSTSAAHAGGTCRMGKGSADPAAVVDSKLRVIGIQNVRVADTSIMSALTNSNTMAAALVIGEKAATMIFEHLERKPCL